MNPNKSAVNHGGGGRSMAALGVLPRLGMPECSVPLDDMWIYSLRHGTVTSHLYSPMG